jgi:endonuclease YncB( thermonuclease family)
MGNCLNILENKEDQTIKNKEEKVEEKIENLIDIYKDSTDENTPYYTYEGINKKVKVLRVIDGDTVDIAFHHEETNKIFKYRVRLYGIDTPEKRPPKNDPNRDKEIAASKVSTNALIEYLKKNNDIVLAFFYKPDKYGRLLCTFYDKCGDDINKWMVKNGYAYEYFGKTKKKYKEEDSE